MEKLVEFIAQSLVEKPEAVRVTRRDESDRIIIELAVDPDDIGKVIGRQGRIAKAIRTVVKAASVKSDKKVVVDIL
ncbi:MAG: KH domain-containing protein [Clostridiales bacterium]|nr:KH domain-containing protein [Clostridiales bacterium]